MPYSSIVKYLINSGTVIKGPITLTTFEAKAAMLALNAEFLTLNNIFYLNIFKRALFTTKSVFIPNSNDLLWPAEAMFSLSSGLARK